MGAAAILLRRFAPYLLGVAGAVAAWIAFGAYIHHVRHVARDEQKAADTAAYTAAQTAAAIKFKAIADAQDASYAAIAAEKDREYDQALASARAAAADYVRRMRSQAALRAAGRTDLPGHPAGPEVDNGHGADAFVPVTLDDLDICAENSVRLQNAHDWAEALWRTP